MLKLNFRVRHDQVSPQKRAVLFMREGRRDMPDRVVSVEPDQPLRVVCSEEIALTCISGTAWITTAEDVRDVVLEPGQRHVAARRARLFINGMPRCELRIEPMPPL